MIDAAARGCAAAPRPAHAEQREGLNMATTTAFTAKDVQELRRKTGAGMMDAKRALEETAGDMAKAAELLRAKGIAKAEKRADRSASEGRVAVTSITTARL